MGAALLALWNVFWVVVMIRLAADEIGGFAEGLGEAVSRLSASTFAWALLAQALISVATGFASLMFIIPGIYVWVKLSLAQRSLHRSSAWPGSTSTALCSKRGPNSRSIDNRTPAVARRGDEFDTPTA